MSIFNIKALAVVFLILFLGGCQSGTMSPVDTSGEKQPIASHADQTDEGYILNDRKAPHEADSSLYYYMASAWAEKQNQSGKIVSYLEKAVEADKDSTFLKLELALEFHRQKNHDAALETAKSILAEDPENVNAMIFYGKLQHKLMKLDEAARTYENIIKLDPERKNIYLHLGRIYYNKKEMNSALRVYSALLQKFPKVYAGHFFIGKIMADKGLYKSAEVQFKKTLSIEPSLIEAVTELIELYKLMENDVKTLKVKEGEGLATIAIEHYGSYDNRIRDHILKHNPSIADPDKIHAGMVINLPSKSIVDGADVKHKIIELYKNLLSTNSNNVMASMDLAYYYHITGDEQKAGEIFKDLASRTDIEEDLVTSAYQMYIKSNRHIDGVYVMESLLVYSPASSGFHYLLGIALDGLKKYERAIDHFDTVKPDSKYYKDAIIHIAYIYQDLKQYENAIELLKEKIDEFPDDPEFTLYLAGVYEGIDDFENAQEILQQGIKKYPRAAPLYYRLGVVYDRLNRKEDAIEQMKKVLILKPKHPNALNHLGYTYAELDRNLDEALQLVLKAMKISPGDGYITDSLGWVYYKMGKYKMAIKYLGEALTLVNDDPTILEHMGDAYLKTGNPKKALEFYERALKKRDEDKEKDQDGNEDKAQDEIREKLFQKIQDLKKQQKGE